MSDKFFGAKKPAAVLKHEILRRYLPVYVRKAGSQSKDRRVAYIDAFAGPGTYDDGSVGSPAVAVETAEEVRGVDDRVDGYFIERDGPSADALRAYIDSEGLDWPVACGEVQTELPGLLNQIDPATALFVFLDPFGPWSAHARCRRHPQAQRRGEVRLPHPGAATEVLLNFSFPGLRRNAGHLQSNKSGGGYTKARQTIIGKVDATMGADWWQAIWATGAPDREEPTTGFVIRR